MAIASEQEWLEQARALVLRSDFAGAERLLGAALGVQPHSFELRRVLSGVYRQTGRDADAEALLRELLDERPQDFGSAFTLAQLLIGQARTQAAGRALRACFESGRHGADLAIRAIELLDAADLKADAAAIAGSAISAEPGDPRLHAYAGMLHLQLGAFDRAREHCLFALEHSPRACEWHVPQGLAQAQRYADVTHPDFARFRACLQRDDLSDRARSTLLFALGKAHDDVGAHRQAAAYFREANALVHASRKWSRKEWRRGIETRLASGPLATGERIDGFVPIFIVGMPRSGTTLLAELLSRRPAVCNRGELPWIAKLAGQADLNGRPSGAALSRGAEFYRTRTRRDDAPDATWFIDKQPLNFRYVDLMLALFPDAKVIHCTRNPRDTALSLWMQSFSEDVQGYACDFDDIALVMRDCGRLMARWLRLHPPSIRIVRYEELVAAPEAVSAALAAWIGLPEPAEAAAGSPSISTSSLWQARQPVYSRSMHRWRLYADHVPELLKFATE